MNKALRYISIFLAILLTMFSTSCVNQVPDDDPLDLDDPIDTTTSTSDDTTTPDDPDDGTTTKVEATTTVPVTTPPATSGTTEAPVTTEDPTPVIDPLTLPKTIYSGKYNTEHVQGIAIDTNREYIYFSFTTILVKTDLQGNVIGTVENLVGHLGDLDFNDEDGRVYGSIEFKSSNVFGILVFDVDRIDRMNIDAQSSGIVSLIELPDVLTDYSADPAAARYGCSGIDGVAFGPAFGAASDSDEYRLMVGYGIYGDTSRQDNDHQVILSYTIDELARNERSFSVPNSPSGGARCENKYFAYTGNTRWGVQSLEYDEHTGYWFIAAYAGSKTNFPNFTLFAIDGSVAPYTGNLTGVNQTGLILSLAKKGLTHQDSGTRGWNMPVDRSETGIVSLGGGYFYISHRGQADYNPNATPVVKETSTATLYKWVSGTKGFIVAQ